MKRKTKAPVNPLYGRNIIRLRDERAWSQYELARKLGYETASYLNTIEKSKRSPGRNVRKKICDIFGVNESELTRSESEWNVARETVRGSGEIVPGSYGVPDLSRHRVVAVATPTKAGTRRKLVDQLDRILEHPELAEAIAANLKAFASAAEYRNEIAALNKKIDELTIQVKILSDALRRNAPGCAELSPDPGDDRKRAIREGLP